MGIVTWVVFGAFVGWIADKFAGRGGQGCLTNIVIGIGGSLMAGAAYTLITGEDWLFRFDLASLIVGILGSIGLLLLLRTLSNRA